MEELRRREALIDDLLAQAYGPDMGRMIAGAYRLAQTAVMLKLEIDAALAARPDAGTKGPD